jgi:hypothetical protein
MSFKAPYRDMLPQFSFPLRLLGSEESQRVKPVLSRGLPAKSFRCNESNCTQDGVDFTHCLDQDGCLEILNIPWLRFLFTVDMAQLL